MAQSLIISNIFLWLVVIALSFVVYALMRQIGILHERVFPAGALASTRGLVVGQPVPPLAVEAWSGRILNIGGTSDESTLLLFVSPQCPICKTLLTYIQSVRQSESADHPLQIVLGSDGEPSEHVRFIEQYGIDQDFYVLSRALGLHFFVEQLPFAALIDEQGILRARGLVNSREHLESLFEARNRGVATLQDYLVGVEKSYEAA